MKRVKILSSLNKIASILDKNRYVEEADKITEIMTRIANNDDISKIFDDMYSDDDRLTQQIKERDLKSHNIIIEYFINDDEINAKKQFTTTVTKADIIKRASIEFVIDTNNLSNGDYFTVNIKAINPRSDEQIWEVEYDVEVEENEKISFYANPMIAKINYDIEDITEISGSDFINDIVERAKKQPPREDPTLEPIRQNLRNFPGDAYEKAYNIALEEVRDMYTMYGLPLDDPNIDEMAKVVAQEYSQSEDKSEQKLNLIIDEVIMEMMPDNE